MSRGARADDPFYGEDLAHIHHTAFGSFLGAAAPEIAYILRREGIVRGLVVDLACGSGILSRALTNAGYDVVGVDASPAMIALARRMAPPATFVVGTIREFDIPACEAVLCVGEGLTYFTPEDPREQLPDFFRRAHAALSPGGILLFDVILTAPSDPMRYRTTHSGPDWRLEVDVFEDAHRAELTRTIDIVRHEGGRERRTREVHRVRLYGVDEIREMLQSAGFEAEVSHAYGAVQLPVRRAAFLARRGRNPRRGREDPTPHG